MDLFLGMSPVQAAALNIGLLIVLMLATIPLWLKLAARSRGSAPPVTNSR